MYPKLHPHPNYDPLSPRFNRVLYAFSPMKIPSFRPAAPGSPKMACIRVEAAFLALNLVLYVDVVFVQIRMV